MRKIKERREKVNHFFEAADLKFANRKLNVEDENRSFKYYDENRIFNHIITGK